MTDETINENNEKVEELSTEKQLENLVNAINHQFGGIAQWMQGIEQSLESINVRLNTVEAIICKPEFAADRKALVSDTGIPVERLQDITKNHVIPEIERKREEHMKAMQEQFEAAQKEAAAQETGLVGPDGQPVSSETASNVVGLDGQPIGSSPQTVIEEEADEE